MKRPIDADYDIEVKDSAVKVVFRPTMTEFWFSRLLDHQNIGHYGVIGTQPTNIRHAGPTGDLDAYSAASDEVYDIGRRLALERARKVWGVT